MPTKIRVPHPGPVPKKITNSIGNLTLLRRQLQRQRQLQQKIKTYNKFRNTTRTARRLAERLQLNTPKTKKKVMKPTNRSRKAEAAAADAYRSRRAAANNRNRKATADANAYRSLQRRLNKLQPKKNKNTLRNKIIHKRAWREAEAALRRDARRRAAIRSSRR